MKATILVGDVLERLRELPDESVQCVVTSPPYFGLRDYGIQPSDWPAVTYRTLGGEIAVEATTCCFGLESTPEAYIGHAVAIFSEVRRVLHDDGTCFINIGDSYAGSRAGHEGFDTSTLEGNRENQRQANIARKRVGKDCDPKRGTAASSQPYRAIMCSRQRGDLKHKDLVGVPWMLAFALRADGWYLRQDVIWSKPNPMPESVTDRCTKAHEYIFLLSKSARYFYNQDAILEPVSAGTHARLSQDVEAQIGSLRATVGAKTNGPMKAVARSYKGSVPGRHDGPGQDRRSESVREGRTVAAYRELGEKGASADTAEVRSGKGAAFGRGAGWRNDPTSTRELRNKRSVWTIPTQSYAEAHFATYPEALVEPCILAGSREGDTVLDPFGGSGTTGAVALRYHRDAILIELNPEYANLEQKRIGAEAPMFNEIEVVPAGASYARSTPAAAD